MYFLQSILFQWCSVQFNPVKSSPVQTIQFSGHLQHSADACSVDWVAWGEYLCTGLQVLQKSQTTNIRNSI